MIALIFLGTFGFLFTYDGFISKSEASGCCGGGEAAVTTFAADSSGDFGSDIPMDTETDGGCCGSEKNNFPASGSNDCNCASDDAACDSCSSSNACGGATKSGCKNCSCKLTCQPTVCTDDSQCNGPKDCGYIK